LNAFNAVTNVHRLSLPARPSPIIERWHRFG